MAKYAYLTEVENHAKLDALLAGADLLLSQAEEIGKAIDEKVATAIAKIKDDLEKKSEAPETSEAPPSPDDQAPPEDPAAS